MKLIIGNGDNIITNVICIKVGIREYTITQVDGSSKIEIKKTVHESAAEGIQIYPESADVVKIR